MRPSIIALSLLALFAMEAHAATFNVTRFDDPIAGACAPADCSLREAMLAAAANGAAGGTDTVALPAGTYTLTRGVLAEVVGQSLHLQGAGSAQTRIATSALPGTDNLLHVRDNGDLRVTGVTLAPEGGAGVSAVRVDASTFSAQDIATESRGRIIGQNATATLRHVQLRPPLGINGTTLVEDSTLHSASQNGSTAQLTLRRVLVDKALYPDTPSVPAVLVQAGSATLEDSTITGGRLTCSGESMTLRRLHYVNNDYPANTESGCNVVVENSLFENNTDRALRATDGGTWTISGSTFRNNRTNSSIGGAILAGNSETLDIRNSTFAGNTFANDAPAGARGAAIGVSGSPQVTLRHVTIVPPTVMPVGSTGSAIGGTGNTAKVEVFNSIVRGTCALEAGVLQGISRGNIENPGNTCGLNAATNQVSVTNAALALGPLADHGGPTPTYSLNAGSVAIDNAHVLYYLPTDQRGYLRSGASTGDIGAFERDGIDRIFKNGFEG